MDGSSSRATGALLSGPSHLVRGFGMWRTRPRLMLMGAIPALIVFVVLVSAFVLLATHVMGLVGWATPFLDGWAEALRVAARALLAIAVLAGALALSAVAFVALTLLIGEPFYAHIWREAEKMASGAVPAEELDWKTSLRDTVALFVRGAIGAALLLLIGLVPVIGSVVAAVGGVLLASWLLAQELLARPFEARGLDARARRDLLGRHRVSVWGFGLAVQACFWVPLGAVVAMPAAVVGATTLAREINAREQATLPPGPYA